MGVSGCARTRPKVLLDAALGVSTRVAYQGFPEGYSRGRLRSGLRSGVASGVQWSGISCKVGRVSVMKAGLVLMVATLVATLWGCATESKTAGGPGATGVEVAPPSTGGPRRVTVEHVLNIPPQELAQGM